MFKHLDSYFQIEQSLTTKLVVILDYNLIKYFFIRGEFLQIHYWL